MTPEQHKRLTDEFDQREGGQLPEDFGGDAEAQQEWEILRLAADAIRLNALMEQVRRARTRFEAEQAALDRSQAADETSLSGNERSFDATPVAVSGKGKGSERGSVNGAAGINRPVVASHAGTGGGAPVRRMISPVLQAAAVVLLVLTGTAVIKVATTRPEGIFEKNYSAYELSVTRGADDAGMLEDAYRQKNWPAVYDAFAATHAKTQKDYFLTAMAHMQQKDYYEAIGLLKTTMEINRSQEPYFEDEAEYYLAMNYLATGQGAAAAALLDKIKADPHHIFHNRVLNMDQLDLRILPMK